MSSLGQTSLFRRFWPLKMRDSNFSSVKMCHPEDFSATLLMLPHPWPNTLSRPKPINTLRSGLERRSGASNNGPCVQQRNKWESALNVDEQITSVTMIPQSKIGCIILFQSQKKAKVEEYRITISTFLSCTCPNFVEMSARALGKRRTWINCKHLYFIFRVTCNLDQYQETFTHVPSFSFNEVKHLLESGIMKHVGP